MEKLGKNFRLAKLLQSARGKNYDDKRKIMVSILAYVITDRKSFVDVTDEWIDTIKTSYKIQEWEYVRNQPPPNDDKAAADVPNHPSGEADVPDGPDDTTDIQTISDFMRFKLSVKNDGVKNI
jgi:hypothetical protein